MLKVDEIKSLIDALHASSVDELNLEQNEMKLSLKKNTTVVQEAVKPSVPAVETQSSLPPQVKTEAIQVQEEGPQDDRNLFTVTSPMVGTFYAAPSPDASPYVKEGDSVDEESVVCIVEAMKLMNPIVADAKGKIVEIVAENGELVEYGQPLMVVERT